MRLATTRREGRGGRLQDLCEDLRVLRVFEPVLPDPTPADVTLPSLLSLKPAAGEPLACPYAPMYHDRMLTPEQFRKVVACFPTGVTVVTARGLDGRPYGVTVNSFTSVSLKPLLVLVCLDEGVSGLDMIREDGWLGINFLAAGQLELSLFFSRKGRRHKDDLYYQGEHGLPLLKNSLASLECRIVELWPAGDHTILLAEPMAGDVTADQNREPLLFYRGGYRSLAPESEG